MSIISIVFSPTVYGISTNAVHGREYTSTDRDILRGNNNETILDNAGTARTFRSAPKKPYKIQNSILSKLDYFIRPSVVPYIKETIPNIIRKAMEIMAYNSTLGIISLLSIISAVLGIGAGMLVGLFMPLVAMTMQFLSVPANSLIKKYLPPNVISKFLTDFAKAYNKQFGIWKTIKYLIDFIQSLKD